MGLATNLTRLFRFSKLIAFATAIFLISASLDNVPDCPELFNAASKSSISVQLAHVSQSAGHVSVASTVGRFFWLATIAAQPVPGLIANFAIACLAPSLHAADSSPPTPELN